MEIAQTNAFKIALESQQRQCQTKSTVHPTRSRSQMWDVKHPFKKCLTLIVEGNVDYIENILRQINCNVEENDETCEKMEELVRQ